MTKFFIEIRNRTVLTLITCLSVFLTVYYYKKYLLSLILSINTNFLNKLFDYFIFTSITEIFSVYLKLDFLITSVVIYYTIFYHLICFLSYGLYKLEYNYIKSSFFFSIFFGWLSIFFCNYIFIPFLLRFFLSFHENTANDINFFFEARIMDYFLFYINSQLSCFSGFQIGVILILFSSYLGNNLNLLKNFRKIIYLFLLFISTVVTPPDVLSQILLFLFLLISFESLIFLTVFKKINKSTFTVKN